MRVARALVAAALITLSACSQGSSDSNGSASPVSAPSSSSDAPAASTTRPGPAPKVVLVGDSMAREARRDIAALGKTEGLDLALDLRGQAAPCSQEQAVLAALRTRPGVVAIEWIGNARFTAGCTTAFEVDEVVAEYRAALDRIVAARPEGTTVALVGIPPIIQPPWDETWQPLDDLFRSVAETEAGVEYIDVDQAIAPGRVFARTLPCTAGERHQQRCGTYGAPQGRAVVRDPEGFHFCPVTYELSTGNCPVASPGAARYARAIVEGLATLVH